MGETAALPGAGGTSPWFCTLVGGAVFGETQPANPTNRQAHAMPEIKRCLIIGNGV